jgi:hypothetical protein
VIEHVLRPGEPLTAVAERYQVSGWQGLYFAGSNHGFRQLHPDPWCLPPGASITIPDSVAEQLSVLAWRQRYLDSQEQGVRRLAAEQATSLSEHVHGSSSRDAVLLMSTLTRSVVSTTVRAITLLKTPDYNARHTDLRLLEDALGRWSLTKSSECASLLSMLARSAKGLPWLISGVAARAWCDAGSPNFWAKLLYRFPRQADPSSDNIRRSLSVILRAHQAASANVLQNLGALRTGAVMEANHLARLERSRQSS